MQVETMVGILMKKKLKENFTQISDDTYVTTERERECLCDHYSPTQYATM